MKKVTIQEYAFRTGVSERTVRRYIEAGKVPAVKEIIENRETTMVLVEEEHEVSVIDVRPEVSHSVSHDVGRPDHHEEQNISLQNTVSDNEKLIDLIRNMQDQLVNYAELAGQAKLLTDSEMKTKNEYFEIIQENKMLIQDRAELKSRSSLLETQLNDYRSNLKEQSELQNKIDAYQKQINDLQKKLEDQEKKQLSWWQKF